MGTAVLTITLLTVIASLVSWLFSQWLARRTRRYLAYYPGDAEMRSLLARALFAAEHPGSASIMPAVVVAEWPQTDCIASIRSDESHRWILDNGCGRVVAVLFALVPLRLGRSGPLVAPIFTIRDAADAPRQIRYLACEITAPGVLQVLGTSGADEERLAAELRADACCAQVLDWSRSGQRLGTSPDMLLRLGID